ncbi:hypothetical protein DRN67_00555 [Candidatus Micrarchaeota archaeon]|nr:MAG: hypothetical protein DRN67_00555 [Candidatus Micrarchaeota archaeon]
MKEWDERFARKGELWGDEPSLGAKLALDYFERKKVRKILDVACGYGKDSLHLARKFEVVGIDSSVVGIRMAGERATEKGLSAKFLLGDVRMMPFPPESFDGILCNGILAHMINAERPKVASEIERVLRRGGCLVVSEFSADRKPEGAKEVEPGSFREHDNMIHHYFSKQELQALFPTVEVELSEEREEKRREGRKARLKWVMAGVKR